MAHGPQVKGLAFRTVLKVLEELHGPSAVEDCKHKLPDDLHDALDYGTVLSGGWYPIDWYRQLLQATIESIHKPPSYLRIMGGRALYSDMNGAFKFLLRMLKPGTLFTMMGKTFNTYYDTGELKLLEKRKGYAHARWDRCTGFNKNMWEEVIGAAEMLFELSGATSIRLKPTKGGDDGCDFLEMTGHWTV